MRWMPSEDLSPELASALIERLTKAQDGRRRQRLFYRLFPSQDAVEPYGTTLYARGRYAKHLEFFAAGAEYRERCLMAATGSARRSAPAATRPPAI